MVQITAMPPERQRGVHSGFIMHFVPASFLQVVPHVRVFQEGDVAERYFTNALVKTSSIWKANQGLEICLEFLHFFII